MKSVFRNISRHIITGFIFIMPVLITLVVLGKFWNRFLEVGSKVATLLRIDTLFGPGGDAIIAVILFLLTCVAAGFLVKMSILKRMSNWLDGKLAGFIPGYSDLKKETEAKIGTAAETVYETCLVRTENLWRPAYIIDVDNNGNATVFIPSTPAFSNGHVAVVSSDNYTKLQIDSKSLNSHLENLGQGLPFTFPSKN